MGGQLGQGLYAVYGSWSWVIDWVFFVFFLVEVEWGQRILFDACQWEVSLGGLRCQGWEWTVCQVPFLGVLIITLFALCKQKSLFSSG